MRAKGHLIVTGQGQYTTGYTPRVGARVVKHEIVASCDAGTFDISREAKAKQVEAPAPPVFKPKLTDSQRRTDRREARDRHPAISAIEHRRAVGMAVFTGMMIGVACMLIVGASLIASGLLVAGGWLR